MSRHFHVSVLRAAAFVLSLFLSVPFSHAAFVPAPGTSSSDAAPRGQGVTVQDTVYGTLRTHHSLQNLQENREAVRWETERARRGYGPRIDITGGAGFGQLSDSTTRSQGIDKGMHSSTHIGATLVQPLWDGFATRSRVRSAESTFNSLTHRVFDNATTLALDALIAHIDVNRRREILRLAQANVERHKEILAQARDRESMGADTMADVTQAQSRLARALSTEVEARASLQDGEDAYTRLTGLLPGENMEPLALPLPMYDGVKAILEEAQRSNPKLAAYLQDVKAARGDKELMESTFWPMINLEAGPQYTDRGGHDDRWTYSFDVMGTLRWNIFNSGADAAGTRAAEARIRQARQALYSLYDDIKLEIENTWTQYLSAKEQHRHYTDAVEYNTLTRDAYEEQFLLGQRSLLDVLDAESELFNSSTQAVTSSSNVLVAGFRMYALGGVLLPKLQIDTAVLDTLPKELPADSGEQWK